MGSDYRSPASQRAPPATGLRSEELAPSDEGRSWLKGRPEASGRKLYVAGLNVLPMGA